MLRLPPGMARPKIPANPSPSVVTDQMWEFAWLVLSLEPGDFEFAGIYADKSGYHNTVTRNLSRWPGTYSVRLAEDLNGVRDKARALDVKSRQAASGAAPTIMAKYGARMRAAAKARDRRVRHWREVLGQFDTDSAPEAIDFQSVVERVPDDTHEWHFHWSILAMWVALAEAYEGMLSVLYGESLDSWTNYERTGDEMLDMNQHVPGVEGLDVGTWMRDQWVWMATMRGLAPRGADGALLPRDDDRFKDAVAGRVDTAALIAGLTAAVGALNLELDDADVSRIVAALRDATDVPLGADDAPAIEAALRSVLHSV